MWLNRGIYDSPYDAFTNYMNILADFIKRVDSLYPSDVDSEELNSLLTTIKNQGDEITELEKEVEKLQTKLAKETTKKATAKKTAEVAAQKEPVAAKDAAKPAAKKATAEPTGKKKAAAKKKE